MVIPGRDVWLLVELGFGQSVALIDIRRICRLGVTCRVCLCEKPSFSNKPKAAVLVEGTSTIAVVALVSLKICSSRRSIAAVPKPWCQSSLRPIRREISAGAFSFRKILASPMCCASVVYME